MIFCSHKGETDLKRRVEGLVIKEFKINEDIKQLKLQEEKLKL